MKKMLWLAVFAIAMAPALQAKHCAARVNETIVKDESTAIADTGKECKFNPGPTMGGECLGGDVLAGCTIQGETMTVQCPAIKCPDMQCPMVTCPVHTCPAIPVCPRVTCEARLVEQCPEGCPAKPACRKRCVRHNHCHRCNKPCTRTRPCKRGCPVREYNELVDSGNYVAAEAHPEAKMVEVEGGESAAMPVQQ